MTERTTESPISARFFGVAGRVSLNSLGNGRRIGHERHESAFLIGGFRLSRFETRLEAFFFASGEAVVVADLFAFDHALAV